VLCNVGQGVFALVGGDSLLYEALVGIEFFNCQRGVICEAFDDFKDHFSRFADPSDVREK
jgi:hypothetical protein